MENPTARHLLLNLLLAIDALGAAEAVRACALFDISANNARVALARLVAAGLVEPVGRGAYRLGPQGRALGADVAAWRQAESRLRPWDGGWVAVHTAALGRTDRAALRRRDRALAMVGLRELGGGLFLRPDNFAGGVAAARERLLALGLENDAHVFLARDFDAAQETRARRLWNAAALERGYRDGRQKLEKSMLRFERMRLDTAAREAFLLGDQAIRQLVFDPMLPEPLVDVEGRRAFVDTVRRYDEAGHRIWQEVLKTV